MKLAISLPDDLARDATAAWNAAIEEAGQPGDEPAVAELRRRSKRAVVRASGSGW